MRIYLAGPMAKGHRIDNIRRALDAAHRIQIRGHFVFIPHLNDFNTLVHQRPDEEWIKYCFSIIRYWSEIVVRIPGPSEGSDKEILWAKQYEKIIFGDELTDGVMEFMHSKYWGNTE